MKLSILIPARNEEFLPQTIEDLLRNTGEETEIIVGMDGYVDKLPNHPRLTTFYSPESIGQRAMTNQLARLSRAKYVMKVDAHCAFDEGFDEKMMAKMQDDYTMVPVMRNLHVFNWVCPNGHTRYQGPSGACEECGEPTTKDVVWIAKKSPQSTSYRFDDTLHFQYFGDYANTPEYKEDLKTGLTNTMSLQGSAFMLTRDKYWELDICDEKHGSWGQQGVEVACKTWLSGGRVVVNHDTWYAHMFRTQGGDFGFPYPNPGIDKARKYSRDLWFNNKWPLAKHDIHWLVDKFAPVPGWTKKKKAAIYYTDNQVDPKIMADVQRHIGNGIDSIVSVSLKPIKFGQNIVFNQERGWLTMFQQILLGLNESDADYVFFTEHDVLYDPSHFEFVPPRDDTYYYNTNVWKLRLEDGFAYRVDDCRQLSGLCANRLLLLQHYTERVRRVDIEGFSRRMGFEPGTHNRAERVDDFESDTWESLWPIIDIRHGSNNTQNRWSPDQYRDKRYTKGWTESDEIPGWGKTKDLIGKLK